MNKIAVLTGATSGMGKANALDLVDKGYELIAVYRDKSKGEALEKDLKARNPSAVCHHFICDLSSVKEVQATGKAIVEKFPKIDVLINNAGAINSLRDLTVDGYERTIATNHLAYFQLTMLLLPALKAAPSARIVNVASMAGLWGKVYWDDFQMEHNYGGFKAYCSSKLMNIMFTYKLAQLLEGTNITANTLHPGSVQTEFGKQSKGLLGFLIRNFGWVLIGPKKGSDTALWLATAPEAEGLTGKYFEKRKPKKTIKITYDQQALDKLWTISEDLIQNKL